MADNYLGKTCPYCQFPIKADSDVVQCPSCKVPHHRECWAENGSCTTFGCRETTYQSAAADRLEISFDELSGREAAPARGGGVNKLLVAALVTTLLVLVVAVFAYINLLSNRTAVIDDPNAPASPGSVSDPGGVAEELQPTYDPALIASLDADYYIDYENGTIPIGDLPIGARVVDPGWVWEYRLGVNYSDRDWYGDPTPPGEVKPVTWLVVARGHYSGMDPHVTLLSEELIGRHVFDNSSNRGSQYGSNHWGDSGTANATQGLRPWLNSTGIHSGEGFHRAFSENFKGALLTTTLPNREWKNGKSYSTQDYVFIPSTTELGDSDHNNTYQIGTAYAYFDGAGNAKRVARLDGETRSYWTRSTASDFGNRVRDVYYIGQFYDGRYSDAYYDFNAVRPALNLKSGILVSEINN